MEELGTRGLGSSSILPKVLAAIVRMKPMMDSIGGGFGSGRTMGHQEPYETLA